MGIFDGLAYSSDEEASEDKISTTEEQTREVTLEDSTLNAETDDWNEGWQSRSARNSAKLEKTEQQATCLVCSRYFSRRYKGETIPCTGACNSEVLVHRGCLEKWREKSNSCPLCRAPMATLTEVSDANSGNKSQLDAFEEEEDADDGLSFAMREIDVKAKRGSKSRRLGKTDTFKAARQRDYAISKRNAQRELAKQQQ